MRWRLLCTGPVAVSVDQFKCDRTFRAATHGALVTGGGGVLDRRQRVSIAIAQWGDRYLADPAGPPVQFAHRDCDAVMRMVATCHAGHEVGDLRRIAPRPGPGATPRDG